MSSLMRVALGLFFLTLLSPGRAEPWQYGVGSGLYALGINGDGGFHTPAGPLDFDVDLNTSDVRDALETAYGLGGYAKRDELTIYYNFGYFELDDNVSGVRDGNQGRLDVTYKSTRAEVAVDYLFAIDGKSSFGALVGLRYIKKEFDVDFGVDGANRFTDTVDDNWLDLVLGLTHSYPLSNQSLWTSRLDIGFGGSEGSYHFDTGGQLEICQTLEREDLWLNYRPRF